MDNNVKHVNFKDELNHKVMLRKLADDDRLKGCVVVCVWDDGEMTTGWSNMDPSLAAIGSLFLQRALMEKASTLIDNG